MTQPKKRRRKPALLSSTRPAHSRSSTPSSRTTRTIIRTHHTLQKQLFTALQTKNTILASTLQSQLNASGGLAKYQNASLAGQSRERGGDSSRVLADWLLPCNPNPSTAPKEPAPSPPRQKWRILDIGALTIDNAIARTNAIDIERIDLHSQHPKIQTQDFMHRPLPTTTAAAFDIISLSLVLNYIGDATARGEMLRRTTHFLRPTPSPSNSQIHPPGLFLVLPKPCVENSRYMDEERLVALMRSLGYSLARRKVTRKLVYYFWGLEGGLGEGGGEGERGGGFGMGKGERGGVFRKEEVRKGKGRNNFAIVLG